MCVISKQRLVKFWLEHPRAEQPLHSWLAAVGVAKWTVPQDVKAQFGNASFIAPNRVVFNIKGNDYRLVVAVAYTLGAMYIKFVGTHQEYDAVNVSTVEPKP